LTHTHRSFCRVPGAHLQSDHDLEVDEEELTELVDGEAYEAMDS
jgi:hypothetical protein